ncbi:prepilin-type N-terminal cleavage/methylation domain-containing protein [Thiocapsa bogorovii]|uniref:prepilin-type N-terminal cleavage/methylation domain-containing protein n=1 Tax=Thiocapsa bogorovii TaxID=521689 RepID=UPI001E41C8F7|nr:prepilin-type N-terminal cleavage/methylation domain-containing protein [Thiocapsa bogorovii]UHD17895.1 prepilin-type N-terminal cleavage/methylation domain-containing protein [Thiocapsa bogorovii]
MPQVQRGFTLIEVMIVLAVIGILAALAVPLYRDFAIRAKVSEALLEMGKVKSELSLFYANHGRFPINATERLPFAIKAADHHPSIRVLEVKGVGACNANAGCPNARMEVMLQRSVYNGIDGDAHSQLRMEGHGGPNGVVVEWLCGPRDIQPLKLEWLPATCRHPPS